MRSMNIFMHSILAGRLTEIEKNAKYLFQYDANYNGPPISMTMPLDTRDYEFNCFPPFFDGLLPEGFMLESLLKGLKIDRDDYFGQLVAVGSDLVGAVTVEAAHD